MRIVRWAWKLLNVDHGWTDDVVAHVRLPWTSNTGKCSSLTLMALRYAYVALKTWRQVKLFLAGIVNIAQLLPWANVFLCLQCASVMVEVAICVMFAGMIDKRKRSSNILVSRAWHSPPWNRSKLFLKGLRKRFHETRDRLEGLSGINFSSRHETNSFNLAPVRSDVVLSQKRNPNIDSIKKQFWRSIWRRNEVNWNPKTIAQAAQRKFSPIITIHSTTKHSLKALNSGEVCWSQKLIELKVVLEMRRGQRSKNVWRDFVPSAGCTNPGMWVLKQRWHNHVCNCPRVQIHEVLARHGKMGHS